MDLVVSSAELQFLQAGWWLFCKSKCSVRIAVVFCCLFFFFLLNWSWTNYFRRHSGCAACLQECSEGSAVLHRKASLKSVNFLHTPIKKMGPNQQNYLLE